MDNSITPYLKGQGISFLPDNKQWENRFEVKSQSSNRLYIIAKRINKNEWGCSCMGWIRYRKCKHLGAVMPMIESAMYAAKHSTTTKPSDNMKPVYKKLYGR